MKNVTAKNLKIGSQVKIGGKLFQVYNVLFDCETLAVARVYDSGKLASPTSVNIGTQTRQEIDYWVKVGSMEIVKI